MMSPSNDIENAFEEEAQNTTDSNAKPKPVSRRKRLLLLGGISVCIVGIVAGVIVGTQAQQQVTADANIITATDEAEEPIASDATLPVSSSDLKSSWPHDQSDIDPDPHVLFGSLDNGIRYMILIALLAARSSDNPDGEPSCWRWVPPRSLSFGMVVIVIYWSKTKKMPMKSK